MVGSRNPTGHRMRQVLFWLCIIVSGVSAFVPVTCSAQPDPTMPFLRGLHAVTVAANIYIDGSALNVSSACRLEQAELERHGANVLHDAGLDAIGGLDKIDRMKALVSQSRDAQREWEKAPPGAKPWDLREGLEHQGREMAYYALQPFLSVHIGVATLGGGMCAAGIRTEFSAHTKNDDGPVINYNGEKVRIPVTLWGSFLLVLTAPAGELQRAVGQRLDSQLSAFVTAWRSAENKEHVDKSERIP